MSNVVSLDAYRKGGEQLTQLRAAAARARRDGDLPRARFFQTIVDHRVAAAQGEMPHAPDFGPKDAA